MKNYLKISTLFFCFILLNSSNAFSQTSDQTKNFHNKTNIAIYKCQKEILRSNSSNFDQQYREILKLELESANYYYLKNYSIAFAFSNTCRKKCLELFPKLNVINTTFFNNTPEEIEVIKTLPATLPQSTLTANELNAINNLDIKVPQQTYDLIKSLN